MCIHCSLRKQKCRLKSTTTNGWRHFGQLEQRKSSVLFPIQSEKSPDSGFFTCDPTKKCIMPSSRERHKGIIGKGHDLRLRVPKSQVLTHASQCPRPLVPAPVLYTAVNRYTCSINAFGLKGFLSKMMFHCVKSHQMFIHFMGYYMLLRLCIKTFHRVL